MVNSRWTRILTWWRPGRCLLCLAPLAAGEELCAPCAASLPHLTRACARCAAPLPAATPPGSACGRCQVRPPPYAAAHAAFRYQPPLDALIKRLKFQRKLGVARLLGARLAQSLRASSAPLPDIVMPVPLHRRRLRERGFNQSLEIARVIVRALGGRLDARGVRRVRATMPQARLARDARRANLRNAFRAHRRYDGLRVAIVDDVLTSGHTVAALTRCLRAAGAREVLVWVAARA